MTANIFVANLDYSVDEKQLKELFSQYGVVKSVKILINRESGNSMGRGFVDMEKDDVVNAIQHLNQKKVMGRKIFVDHARQPQKKFEKRY